MKKKIQTVFQAVTFISVMFFMTAIASMLLRYIPFRLEILYLNCTAVAIGFGFALLNKKICFGGGK